MLPVELNAILFRNELTLQRLHARRAEELAAAPAPSSPDAATHLAAAARYGEAAAARRAAMDGWMWDEPVGLWRDVLWRSRSQLPQLTAAAFTPLWAGCHSVEQAAAAAKAFCQSGLLQPAGALTTLEASGEQWDAPNAWPPLQQMLVEGFDRCGAPGTAELAAELAGRWLGSNLLAWEAEKTMHEKTDATRPGERGGGGEYTPQVGFGWSIGAALWMLERYVGERRVMARVRFTVATRRRVSADDSD